MQSTNTLIPRESRYPSIESVSAVNVNTNADFFTMEYVLYTGILVRLSNENPNDNKASLLKKIMIVYRVFLKNFKNCKAIAQNLAACGKLKMQHAPLPSYQIFNHYIEEYLEILRNQNSLEPNINNDWIGLKVLIAESIYCPIDLRIRLTMFLERIESALEEIGMHDPELKPFLLLLIELFRFPYIPSLSFIIFFETVLQNNNLNQVEKLLSEKLGNTAFSVSTCRIPFPASAYLAYFQQTSIRIRTDLLWAKGLWEDKKKELNKKNLREDEPRFYISAIDYFLQKALLLTQPFADYSKFFMDWNSWQKTLQALGDLANENCLPKIKIEPSKKPTKQWIATYNKIVNVILSYICMPINTIWSKRDCLDNADLKITSLPEDLRRPCVYNFISMNEFYGIQKKSLPPIVRVSKNAKKKNRTPIVLAPQLENNEESEASIIIASDSSEVAIADNTGEVSLPPKPFTHLTQMSQACLNHAKSIKGNQGRVAALVQSYWHFEKCSFIQQLIISQEISPKDYANLFSAYIFSAALGIEQIYVFRLGQAQTKLNSSHDLLLLHQTTCNNNPIPLAVSNLSSAIHIARRFCAMHEQLEKSTFQRNSKFSILQKLYSFAVKPESHSLSSFRLLINQIQNELLQVLPQLAPFIENPTECLTPLETSIDLKDILEITFAPSIHVLQEICPKNGSLSLKQAIQNLKMLQQTILWVNKSRTYREFSFWATRCLFLVQEVADFMLRTLSQLKTGHSVVTHHIATLATDAGISLPNLGSILNGMSMKLKYPVDIFPEGLGSELVDQLEVLRYYPGLDDGEQIEQSALIPKWKLPLKDVCSNTIVRNINDILKELAEMINNHAITAIKNRYFPL